MLNNDKGEFFMLPEALDHCPVVKEIPQIVSTREVLLQLKLLIKPERSLCTLNPKPFPAWLSQGSIQSRDTSCVCAFAILHPTAFASGLNKR